MVPNEEQEQMGSRSRPLWRVLVELGQSVPPEEWAKVPRDLARNSDHYLYGGPKEDEEGDEEGGSGNSARTPTGSPS